MGTSSSWFEEALSPYESTASALADQIFGTNARILLLCGDSTLALTILQECARRAWERQGLASAAAAGRAAHRDGTAANEADWEQIPVFPLERVILLDERAGDLRREYLATVPSAIAMTMPEVRAQSGPWKDHLLAVLDDMAPAAPRETVVVIADAPDEGSTHEAGRAARLHSGTPVFVLASDGAGTSGAIFDLLLPFQRAFLVDGEAPEDAWTRMTRHWHECFRLSHPPAPGHLTTVSGRPWADLDRFIRQDNILQLHSIVAAVVARGRRWVPSRVVPPGSFIEVSDHDLEEVAFAEHTRWYQRRLTAGWSASPLRTAAGKGRVNSRVVPWTDLPAGDRRRAVDYLRSQLAQLEDLGFMPIVPPGGPPEASTFHRVGTVQAFRLRAGHPGARVSGDKPGGGAGEWCVLDGCGNETIVQDMEFRVGHEPLGGDFWRRTGTVHAWQVTESLALRTTQGRAAAHPGDWIVEGQRGERWPVLDSQFKRAYKKAQPLPNEATRLDVSFG